MLIEILIILFSLFCYLYLYLTRHYDYWEKRGVVYLKPRFPLGNSHDQLFGKADAGSLMLLRYSQHKKEKLKYYGGFVIQQPTLTVADLDIIKHILTKDFHHFTARDFVPTTHEYISKHLFALEGKEWKEMRTKLTPTFTSGKMKNMFTLMEKCAEQLQKHIDDIILITGEFQVKDLIARFTTDIIATCAFGLEVNSIKDRENEFYKVGQMVFVPTWTNFAKFIMHMNFPKTSRFIKLDFYPVHVSQFLKKLVKDTIEYRKCNNVSRNDFIDLLLKVRDNSLIDDDVSPDLKESNQNLELRNGKSKFIKGDKLSLEEMVAQAFVFFSAGFETAASTTSFCLYELAMNTDIQERLRAEVDEVMARHEGKLTYQALQEMVFMDQVLNETLRRYASLPFLTRVCTEKYQIPGTYLVIDKGVRVNIPSYAIHHDPDIYPDPFRFDPDRFSEENSRGRHHYSFIPFGEGPRICIGSRFGRLQVKVGLAAILSRYQLSPAPTTPSKLELDPFMVMTTPKQPFSLKIAKRTSK